MSVVVTGLGAVCALGENSRALWDAVERGAGGISIITRFDVTPFDVHLGAMVASGDSYSCDEERLLAYGIAAAEEALEQAKILDRERVALVLGTCNGLLGREVHIVTSDIAGALGLGGPALTVSTACASSAHALGLAAGLLRQGAAEHVLAGGVDTLCPDVFAGFHSLGLLSKEACAPFSLKMGTTLGEGAAFMLLETQHSADARAVEPVAEMMGFGLSADGFHDTKPDPSGSGMARALAGALKEAALVPEDIDYINAHGTATAANDAAEWRAIQRVFGDRSDAMPVSSSKSFLGHAQGAAGALEAVVTLMAMARGVVPPTANYTERRPNSPVDPVAALVPRPHAVRRVVCCNAAFGGTNTALVFGRPGVSLSSRRRNGGRSRVQAENAGSSTFPRETPRTITVRGAGVVDDARQVSRHVPRGELRGTDASARLLAGAVAGVLTEAGVRLRTRSCEGIGLFAAQTRVSPESAAAFERSIHDRGLTHLSAPAFTRMVVSYATGVCCRLYGLKGPTATISTGAASGLSALVLAADHLAWHDDADDLLTAAVDDPGPSDAYPAAAAGLLLSAAGNGPSVSIAGWGLGANRESAMANGLRMAGRRREEVSRIVGVGPSASEGIVAVADAAQALRTNAAGPVLVSGEGAAVVLEIARFHAI